MLPIIKIRSSADATVWYIATESLVFLKERGLPAINRFPDADLAVFIRNCNTAGLAVTSAGRYADVKKT